LTSEANNHSGVDEEPITPADALWLSAQRRTSAFLPNFVRSKHTDGHGPDVLCIGAQKAGTSWLHTNLLYHPDVFAPPIKEISYFSSLYVEGASQDSYQHRVVQTRDAREWWEKHGRPIEKKILQLEMIDSFASPQLSDAWYRAIYRNAGVDQIGIDVSPAYSIAPREAIRHALSLNPNVRVIVLLRDPVERALSHALMLLPRSSGEASRALLSLVESDVFMTLAAYSDYATWLQRWMGMVDRSRILIEFLPNIARNPFLSLKRICNFIGVPYHHDFFPAARDVVFANDLEVGDRGASLAVLRQRLAPAIADFRARLPEIAEKLEKSRFEDVAC
jgi:hypothetical protein